MKGNTNSNAGSDAGPFGITPTHTGTLTTFSLGAPKLNGLECPKCTHQLMDEQSNITLTSWPLQKTTVCSNPKCDYTGYRTI